MPEPQDFAALREVAEKATPGPWECDETSGVDDFHMGHVATPVIEPMGYYGPRLNDARHIAAFDPPTVLAVLSEVERGRALRAAVEALVGQWEEGDIGASALVRGLLALLAAHVPSPLPVGGAAGAGEGT